jgi:uncharacterized protein (DUF2141 family)
VPDAGLPIKNKPMKYKLFILTMLFAAVASVARANTTDPSIDEAEASKKTDITGGVVHADTKKPLGNVAVTVFSSARKEKVVYTDVNGSYTFTDLKAGTYTLVFEKDGLKKVTKNKINIRPDEGCQLNIEMDDEEEFRILPGSLFDFD